MKLTLEKPIKITIDAPSGLEPDFETVGKLIDNIIVMANNQKLSLLEEGKDFSCEFIIGKKSKYRASFRVMKTLYVLTISYLRELNHKEATRSYAITPKEKMMVKEAEKLAKEQVKEKEKQDKKDKVLKALAKKKKKTKEDKFSDLD